MSEAVALADRVAAVCEDLEHSANVVKKCSCRLHHAQVSMADASQLIRDLSAEISRLSAQLNTPEIAEFIEGVKREAAHQRERWGKEHDRQKTPDDWLWIVAHLLTKATQAKRYGDHRKYLHHIVTGAAVLANWHDLAVRGEV